MEIYDDIPSLIAELDALRAARGLSYQSVADACNVSKATIYRTLTGATEPTMQLVQKIAAAVQYMPPAPVVEDTVPDRDGYVDYLKAALQRQSAENEMRVQQLHAHYNMLRNQDRRTIRILATILMMLVAAFIFWLIIDVTHPTVGWFQREIAYGGSGLSSVVEWAKDVFLSA